MKNKKLAGWAGVVSVVIIMVVIGLSGAYLISGAMRSTEFYQHSVDIALSDRTVLRTLGEPVKPGWWVVGSISTGGMTEEGELRIPLKGSKGDGILFAAGRVDAGIFTYFNLVVSVSDSGEIIDLRR